MKVRRSPSMHIPEEDEMRCEAERPQACRKYSFFGRDGDVMRLFISTVQLQAQPTFLPLCRLR
jgi:hypothetical protein